MKSLIIVLLMTKGNEDNLRPGNKVKYIGSSDAQVRWGCNDDPTGFLTECIEYVVDKVEVHSFHTKVILKEFPDKKFNSCSFEVV